MKVTSGQNEIDRAKLRFLLGSSLLLSGFYFSLLRQHEFGGFQVTILLIVTASALVFDYLKLGQFLTQLREKRKLRWRHEAAIEFALETTVKSPVLLKLLATPLLTLYYAFFAKIERDVPDRSRNEFSYDKFSNANDVFLFVAISQLPFMPFLHVFIETNKSPIAAWVVTLLTLWSVIWYLAQVQAVKLRPIELAGDTLNYRYGLIWKAAVPLSKIAVARALDVTEDPDEKGLFLSPFGSNRNVLLEFECPIQFVGPFWVKTRKQKAAISVDNASRFLSELAHKNVLIDKKNYGVSFERRN